ncbi:MAG: hypothetical protein AAFR44_11130, partial [Pseudomonadota bacterium]
MSRAGAEVKEYGVSEAASVPAGLDGAAEGAGSSKLVDRFSYDDAIVRMFFWATMIWGLVGLLVGVIIAFQMAAPQLN